MNGAGDAEFITTTHWESLKADETWTMLLPIPMMLGFATLTVRIPRYKL